MARLNETDEVVGALFAGGTEKIEVAGADTYGVPLVGGPLGAGGRVELSADRDPLDEMVALLGDAIGRLTPDKVVDLSDEPVIGYRERFRLASHALARGVAYAGADFVFEPPRQEHAAARPSIAIAGTGKRVGKTAVSAYLARRLVSRDLLPVVVAMGRGGPGEPELVRGDRVELTVDDLIARAAAGAHAASDYFEDAVMSRVPTVGCRRCGGGLAGRTYIDNVLAGAAVANDVAEARIQVYEGSGAAFPPVATGATLLVAPATQPVDEIAGLFGTYRLLRADLLVVTMCEPAVPPEVLTEIATGVRRECPGLPIVCTAFRPKPLSSIGGRRVFLLTTASPTMLGTLSDHLEEQDGCEVVAASASLSARTSLREEIAKAPPFDTLVTELKAAAVDVAAMEARRRGAEVVLYDNVPVDAGGEGALDPALDALVDTALARHT